MDKEKVLGEYIKVRDSLDMAINKTQEIKLVGVEEKSELNNVLETLRILNNSFKDEIERLMMSSEWDKYCMAFFGETNAGKSTIIDALRIVYDEMSRREELISQGERFVDELDKNNSDYDELRCSLKLLNDKFTEENTLIKRIEEEKKLLEERFAEEKKTIEERFAEEKKTIEEKYVEEKKLLVKENDTKWNLLEKRIKIQYLIFGLISGGVTGTILGVLITLILSR